MNEFLVHFNRPIDIGEMMDIFCGIKRVGGYDFTKNSIMSIGKRICDPEDSADTFSMREDRGGRPLFDGYCYLDWYLEEYPQLYEKFNILTIDEYIAKYRPELAPDQKSFEDELMQLLGG